MDYDREAVFKEHPEWRQSDEDEPETVDVLIYSASTSVGLYAAQMARLRATESGRRSNYLARRAKLNISS